MIGSGIIKIGYSENLFSLFPDSFTAFPWGSAEVGL
jgi:hypothetical protein